jgi:hypothetical protein
MQMVSICTLEPLSAYEFQCRPLFIWGHYGCSHRHIHNLTKVEFPHRSAQKRVCIEVYAFSRAYIICTYLGSRVLMHLGAI